MKQVLINEYGNLKQLNIPVKKEKNKCIFNFINGAFVEIVGSESKKYIVKFYDRDKEKLIYETEITNNM